MTDRHTPTRVGAAASWVRVRPGISHTCGIRDNDTRWCWGINWYGQLGLGDTDTRLVPTHL